MRILNNVMIIGIDHGYGNMKTAGRVFPASVERDASLATRTLLYEVIQYGIGGSHKNFATDKTTDEDYYLLTMAALGEELKVYGRTEGKVHLAVGLPLYWVKSKKESFEQYLMKKRELDFTYQGKNYHVEITGVSVFPQGFAALAASLNGMKGLSMLSDIGNGTMNIMYLNEGMPVPDKIFTEQYGTHQCMLLARNELISTCKTSVPEEVIEAVLRTGHAEIDQEYENAIREVAKEYVSQVFAKLTERGYNAKLMKLYVIGGGGCLIKYFGSYEADRVLINGDICATAKGYEYLAFQKLTR